MNSHCIYKYEFAKKIICDEGYEKEILWQSNLNFYEISESCFLRELAWVILSAGMREQIIRKFFKYLTPHFYNWKSAEIISRNEKKCFKKAIKIFKNEKKINGIIASAKIINQTGYTNLKEKIEQNPIDTLKIFPYVGNITVYHLAKNIGLNVAKPDRHLVKIAKNEGFNDVQEFCKYISDRCEDSIPVIDIVFWRFANLNSNYLDDLSSINFNDINECRI